MAQIPNTRGNPQASEIAVQDSLTVANNSSREDLQAVLQSLDTNISKSYEDRNSLLAGGGTIAWDSGTGLVTFSAALTLHLTQRLSAAAVIVDLTSTTRTLSADGKMLYAVVDRTAGTATVTDDATNLPQIDTPSTDVFLIARRVGTDLYFRNGFNLLTGQSGSLTATTLVNPMDSAGDLIVGGASGSPAKLDHPGVQGQVLYADSTTSVDWNANVTIDSAGEVTAKDFVSSAVAGAGFAATDTTANVSVVMQPFDTNAKIGTTSNHDLQIRTNDITRLLISAAGNTTTTGQFRINPNTGDPDTAFIVTQSGGEAVAEMYTTLGPKVVQIHTSGNSYFNGGNVGFGLVSPTGILHAIKPGASSLTAGELFDFGEAAGIGRHIFNGPTSALSGGESTANCSVVVRKDTGTSRSINASGTVNASGSDYAEYMTKANTSDTIEKGEVCGVNSDGKLTKVFSEAVSFVVKSTDPSYVGGDTWFCEEKTEEESLEDFKARMETARQTVDRIAFSGRAPVIISNSYQSGDYVVPTEGPNGEIVAVAVDRSECTFEQYKIAVGQIWSTYDSTVVQASGRPFAPNANAITSVGIK